MAAQLRQQVHEDAAMETPERPRRRRIVPRPAQRSGWISSAEAIAYLGLGARSSLYWHIEQNRLPYGRIGSRYRFKVADLDAWVDRMSAAAIALTKVG